MLPPGRNPCKSVRHYRVDPHKERFLTFEELARLGRTLDIAPAKRLASRHSAAAIRLLVLTGCRRNEIMGLAWDGTEINARELEMTTHRAQNLGDRRDAFEQMRDAAADAYRRETGDTWRPRRGSHTSQTGHLTSAAIDARDFMRARKERETRAHLPEGTLVAVAGGKQVANPDAIIARLEKAKEKYADLILVHGGGPGVERIAAQWAERNGVHQVVCKPDWNAHGRAAPFRRNDELLNLLPKGVIAFPGSGITDNLVDKAVALGIPVQRCAA